MTKFLLAILLFAAPALAEYPVPALPHPVNDYANVLSSTGKEAAAQALVDLKKDTGVQGGVLIVDSLKEYDIESASNAVARKWSLGSKERNDGVLLMISVKDRKSRIEVGYGLEGFLTDAKTKQILAASRGFFKTGDFNEGVYLAIRNISDVVKANKAEIGTRPAPKTDGGADSFFAFLLGFGVLFILFSIVMFVIRKRADDREKRDREFRAKYPEFYVPPTGLPDHVIKERARTIQKEVKREASGSTYIPVPIPYSSSRSDDDDSSSSSSSSSSDSSSSSSSDWGGGGGDFGGGGSSDSF